MREELTFWVAVALVAVAAMGVFRLVAAGPARRFEPVRRLEQIIAAPPTSVDPAR